MLSSFVVVSLTKVSYVLHQIDLPSNFYRPRREASEGYVFTGICLSKSGGGGGQHQRSTTSLPLEPGHNTSLPPQDQITTPPPRPGHNTSLQTRSQHLPLPGTRSQHLPPDQVTTPPPPWDQVTTPPSPPGTRSQHLPLPRTRSQYLPLHWDQVTTRHSLLGPGHNTSLPPGTRSQHLPPPHPGLCAGGRYTSYWNAFLFFIFFVIDANTFSFSSIVIRSHSLP